MHSGCRICRAQAVELLRWSRPFEVDVREMLEAFVTFEEAWEFRSLAREQTPDFVHWRRCCRTSTIRIKAGR